MIIDMEAWAEWLPELLSGFVVSVEVTFFSLLLGIPIGLIFALAMSSRSSLARSASILLVEVGRGVPALILLQLAYFGLPDAGITLTSMAASIVGLAYCTASYTSEIMRGALQAIPSAQREAADCLGLSGFDAMKYVMIPQGVSIAIPPLLGFGILMLQSTSLCFTVALPEIVAKAYEIGGRTFQYLSVLMLAGGVYLAFCIPATLFVQKLESRFEKNGKR